MPRQPVYRDPSGNLKPWKHGPKVYKSGQPGVSGRARLERSARALLTQAHRFARKPESPAADAAWARGLVQVLQAMLTGGGGDDDSNRSSQRDGQEEPAR